MNDFKANLELRSRDLSAEAADRMDALFARIEQDGALPPRARHEADRLLSMTLDVMLYCVGGQTSVVAVRVMLRTSERLGVQYSLRLVRDIKILAQEIVVGTYAAALASL